MQLRKSRKILTQRSLATLSGQKLSYGKQERARLHGVMMVSANYLAHAFSIGSVRFGRRPQRVVLPDMAASAESSAWIESLCNGDPGTSETMPARDMTTPFVLLDEGQIPRLHQLNIGMTPLGIPLNLENKK